MLSLVLPRSENIKIAGETLLFSFQKVAIHDALSRLNRPKIEGFSPFARKTAKHARLKGYSCGLLFLGTRVLNPFQC